MERRCGDGKESKFQEDLTDAISSFWYRPTLKSQAHRFSAQEIQKSLAQISDREFSSLIDLLLRWLKEGSESAVVGVRLENVNELRKTGKTRIGNREISLDNLARIFKLVVLSEHYLDKVLLLPREMRERDLSEIAKAAGLDPEGLRSFYFRWHSEYRKRFYDADDES